MEKTSALSRTMDASSLTPDSAEFGLPASAELPDTDFEITVREVTREAKVRGVLAE